MLIRKVWAIGPARLTVSRKGAGASIGGSWWRLQRGPAGGRLTLRVPGTQLSWRRDIKR